MTGTVEIDGQAVAYRVNDLAGERGRTQVVATCAVCARAVLRIAPVGEIRDAVTAARFVRRAILDHQRPGGGCAVAREVVRGVIVETRSIERDRYACAICEEEMATVVVQPIGRLDPEDGNKAPLAVVAGEVLACEPCRGEAVARAVTLGGGPDADAEAGTLSDLGEEVD